MPASEHFGKLKHGQVGALVWRALPLNQNTWALDHWINGLPLCSVEASRVAANLGSLILSQSDPRRER
jgi:hypothetical protein